MLNYLSLSAVLLLTACADNPPPVMTAAKQEMCSCDLIRNFREYLY